MLDDVLDGGVNASLGLDSHGKALSFLLLDRDRARRPPRSSNAETAPSPASSPNDTEERHDR